MSDIMRPIPFGQLMNWVLTEQKTQGTVFGVSKSRIVAMSFCEPRS